MHQQGNVYQQLFQPLGFLTLKRLRVASFALLALCAWLTAPLSAQIVIQVPADQSTIQQAIDAAVNGDTVVVAPGTYFENLRFGGKAITVRSEAGAAATVVDGNAAGSVVTFDAGEGADSILEGFTLRNGSGGVQGGGGVRVQGASPTILNNHIVDNVSCTSGGGVKLGSSSALLQGNLIAGNSQSGCSGGSGGGVYVVSAASAQIVDNVIENNAWGSGGGISLFAAGTPTLSGNMIRNNTATLSSGGGGLYIVNVSDALIVQNLITGNVAPRGGGIYWLVPSSGRGPKLVNNTVVANDSALGSGLFADGFDVAAELVNNVIVAAPGQAAVYCGDFNDLNPPLFSFNNVYGNGGSAYGGICVDQSGSNGNVSANPLFIDAAAGNYGLQLGSPSIDAGDSGEPDLPALDFEGDPRLLDGNGDGLVSVDQGVDEVVVPGVTLPTPEGAFCAAATATVREARVRKSGFIDGDVRSVGSVIVQDNGSIFGSVTENDPSVAYGPISLPAGLPSLGAINVSSGSLVLPSGEIEASELQLNGSAEITVEGDAQNPTILYVTGTLTLNGDARLNADGEAGGLVIVLTSSQTVNFRKRSVARAAVFAPRSLVNVRGRSEVIGSLVGDKVVVTGNAGTLVQETAGSCAP